MKKIRVMIVDDHEVVREGLKQILSLDDQIEILGEAASGLECLEILEDWMSDIILMDIRMTGINGIETTRLICKKYPELKVIMLTLYGESQYVTDAIQAGAKGYVLKSVKRKELVKIIHDIHSDRTFLDPKVTEAVFENIKQKETQSKGEIKIELTKRELEILKYIVDGFKERQIAETLFISEHTVRSHVKNIYKKFRVTSRSQAVAKAVRENIINSF